MRLLLTLCIVVSSTSFIHADDEPLSTILFGSCADQDKFPDEGAPIFETMSKMQPDLLIFLGDTIYADLKTDNVTVETIQEKYDILAKQRRWQQLVEKTPVMATWDDHDYGHNDAGVEWELKDESQKIFMDFYKVPEDSPRRQQKGVYDAKIFGPEGKRVQVIVLDERYHRSPLNQAKSGRIKPYYPTTTEGATFLGAEQWAWLEEQLKQPAEIRLIGSGVQVISDDHPFEKFNNIPAERKKLYKLINDTKANGIIFLSGDRHLAELSLATDALTYPLYDVTSSGLTQAFGGWRALEENTHRVAGMQFGNNFGAIMIDWDAATVSMQIRDEQGEITIRQTIPIKLLTHRSDVAIDSGADEMPLPEGVINSKTAMKKVGEEVILQMRVGAGRAIAGGKRILLNSEQDFRSPNNFTIVINESAMTGKLEDATFDTFAGKIIRVKGKVTTFRDAPQIQVDDAENIEIVK